jgi:hypothetical protein
VLCGVCCALVQGVGGTGLCIHCVGIDIGGEIDV